MSTMRHYVGWVREVGPGSTDPGYGQGHPMPPHVGGGPSYPGAPADPGWGIPGPPYPPHIGGGPIYGGGGPVDPGYGRPGWGPADPGYGRPDFAPGYPSQGLPPGGVVGGGPIVPPYLPALPIELPPGASLPPDTIWPAPPNTIWPPRPPRPGDKPPTVQPPIVIPPGKVAIAVWVSGYGRYFTIIDKPEEPPEAQPKK